MDHNFVKLVAEDLKLLRNEWDQTISDVSLRQSSNILRNLLVYNHLQKVANYLQVPIYINSPETLTHQDKISDPSLSYYQCGGALYNGGMISSVCKFSRALTDEECRKMLSPKAENEMPHPVKLSKYLQEPSFIIEGIRINRLAIITYVANKLGGTHYDTDRKPDKEEHYILLDQLAQRLKLLDKNAIYYELLSIGQKVAKSPSVNRIYEIIGHLA